MTAQITLWTYLWDLVDDGTAAALDEIRDLGLNAISLATHYHSVEHYRPHTRGAFIYREDSALYFQPELARYAGTRIRHRVAPLVAKHGNPMQHLAAACAARGLNLLSWTLACHSSWIGRTYPDCTQESCFGDRYPEALCPANPEVRGFLKGLVGDLSNNYGVNLIELESCHFAPSRHFHHHEKLPMPLGATEHFLLSLCFCKSCTILGTAAGVDMTQLRAMISIRLRASFAAGQPERASVAEVVAQTPGLPAFLAARCTSINTLMRDLRQASSAPLSPITWASMETSGLDPAQVAPITDSLTICAYTKDPAEARRAIREAAAAAGGAGKLRVGYHCFPPVTPDGETLLKVIAASLEEGVRAFSFYNYGIAPRPCLAWLKPVTALIRQQSR
jgi:hypothetical protein